jgi:hypothetical protein
MPFPDVRDAKKVSYTEGSLFVSRTSVREHLTIHGLKSVIQKRNKMTATAKKHVYMSDLHFEHKRRITHFCRAFGGRYREKHG